MDFFQRQDQARRNTVWLEVYFALAVIGTIVAVYIAAIIVGGFASIRYGGGGGGIFRPGLLAVVTLGTLAVIGGGCLYKVAQLSQGGIAVAEMMGGRVVPPNTRDPDEQKLLHVVEEMSIASGTPTPAIYVLPNEQGINAFAAGYSTNDTVICATKGCLKWLTRDELQGVIGHEFSHILNGDMRLNLRLMGLVFGILCLTIIGRILLNTRGRRGGLPLAGLALLAIGSIGAFFAKLIKSAVSRQREFLADASAVQFTRNPLGLAGALKKVGGCGSCIDDPNAEDVSHLFFANGLRESFFQYFSTHPPIEDRIFALDPAWDGKFIVIDVSSAEREARNPRLSRQTGTTASEAPPLWSAIPPVITEAGAAGFLAGVGSPTVRHLEYAADLKSRLPSQLLDAVRDPLGAVSLIYALLLSQDPAIRSAQLALLQKDPLAYAGVSRLLACAQSLESRARMPLAGLCMNALRHLSAAQYESFTAMMQSLIASDGQIDLFEYMLQKTVQRRLDPGFKSVRKPITQYYVFKPVASEAAIVLSALARVGSQSEEEISRAFQLGARQLRSNDEALRLQGPSESALAQVDAALEKLNQSAPHIKRLLLLACAETVAADGVIVEQEAELLRAIADALDCPAPPFLTLE
jgi:Zn-dependent protease with chaperone function/uncharacterized tellurite resistance protein B-like protein